MRFRFQKMIERLEWTATIEVRYSAEPFAIPHYTDDSPATGGVQEWEWGVVSVERASARQDYPIAAAMVQAELELDPDFDDRVRDWCLRRFARREAAQPRRGV
jgi:hypothetical protein